MGASRLPPGPGLVRTVTSVGDQDAAKGWGRPCRERAPQALLCCSSWPSGPCPCPGRAQRPDTRGFCSRTAWGLGGCRRPVPREGEAGETIPGPGLADPTCEFDRNLRGMETSLWALGRGSGWENSAPHSVRHRPGSWRGARGLWWPHPQRQWECLLPSPGRADARRWGRRGLWTSALAQNRANQPGTAGFAPAP